MNKSQKLALQHHHPDLVRDLDLTADLVAKLLHHGIFNEDMIEDIKSVKPRKEQIQRMLLRLPRRGPRAFEMFVHSIHESYHWLADDLRKTHHKICLKTESETMSLKEKVDIYVHEQFGQSKRLSEKDKKDIRKFLYKQLESHSDDEPHYNLHSRRNSIQSDVSDNDNLEGEDQDNNKEVSELLSRIYRVLNGKDNVDEDLSDKEVTIEMIEQRADELNKKVEDLTNEVRNSFSVLGLEGCKYSLPEVLETYKEKNQSQVAELAKFNERVEKLKKQRAKLEDELNAKQRQLQNSINDLANVEHEHEKSKALIADLRLKCERLDGIQMRHLEKQQTLMTLKSMVKELKPLARESHEHFQTRKGFDEVDSGTTLHLPKLSSKPNVGRSTRLSRKSTGREITHILHNDYPQPKQFENSSHWKY